MADSNIIIAGKDYLTGPEAAAYMCVSHSQFRQKRDELGLRSMLWMGKKVYRKSDLQGAMDAKWRQSTNVGGRGISTGGRRGGSTV